ncbi:MAG: TIM-barrel domain-containing protein, partial [Polyangiales bacterium]
GYWIDRPYATAIETFDFEPSAYPDPKSMLAELHALGFATAVWHAPYVDKKDPLAATQYAFAQSSGCFPPVSSIDLNPWSAPLDLTNGAAASWWQSQLGAYRALGVDGFKLDYGEDVAPGALTIRTPWTFANGHDEQTMHSEYALAYHSTYASIVDPAGSFMLCRHGVWGDQANGCVIWPGDLDASFALHGDAATDASGSAYVSVGGLPASMIAGISLGPSGFPFYAADTGGYRHSPPDKELFVRWFEETALSSAMEIGTGSSTVAWETLGNPGFDAETLTLYRQYTRLHLRLFPYAWTYARRLAVDGHPIVRPVGLAHPELGKHPSDAFLFGEDLYVAPVVTHAQTTRAFTLPQGDWFDWWTGARRSGDATMDAPLDTLPLMLRAGGMVPMLRDTIDTLAATTEPSQVDSFVTNPGVLTVRVAPGPERTFTIYDGTTLFQATSAGVTTLRIGQGSVFRQGAIFELLGIADVASVAIDAGVGGAVTDLSALANASGWIVTSDGVVHVRVLGGVHTIELTQGQ